MRILVIEDDKNKVRQICELIRESFPEIEVTEQGSYQSGLKADCIKRFRPYYPRYESSYLRYSRE